MPAEATSPATWPPYLDESTLDTLIQQWLAEDIGSGDVTTEATVPPERQARGLFLAKAGGIIAGLQVATRIFQQVDPNVRVYWHQADGSPVTAGTIFGTVEGAAQSLLMAERLALNLLQRMSGIATATHRLVERVRPYGTKVLDTRKTAPGLRLLDKWAVRLGGGVNHRLGLYDMILIKDNHIAAAGGIREAIEAAHRYRAQRPHPIPIEIEAHSLEDVDAILAIGGVDWILLDNFAQRLPDGTLNVAPLREAVQRINGRFYTEASGNISLETAEAIAATGVDAISCGALTHSVQALDLSLELTL
ncbi:carboxylating nicotinate-nucleotide diphosphorylase [Rhodothermus profundi]|uniref:nicotinate-nucleotide diphosphorylase (carboxylating) n=1 Tax=Rhodothermus profundi TaxID=633813 RepID=A0A1M6TT10_9BACT|nr:carboxylating nicotinate-nucleotide diphosphorylase [Rhodothermus profundi]SHK60064.1 nicotinate-nucleotide pyrophosphorylase [carboxylating] [Rhodothermus profundi]